MNADGLKIGAIIPALNAARHLGPLLDEIAARQPALRVLVVDDGSSDGTAKVAATHGAEVAIHTENRGKGAALMTGFAWAVADDLDWVFTLDADGQHLPADMAGFLTRRQSGDADIVVGSRMDHTADMPWLRKVTNMFTSAVVSRLSGCRIPDSQNGYRLFRVAVLRNFRSSTARYDFESEVLVRLARRGARIVSAPTATVYGDERSSINPFRDTLRFFRLVWRLRRDRE